MRSRVRSPDPPDLIAEGFEIPGSLRPLKLIDRRELDLNRPACVADNNGEIGSTATSVDCCFDNGCIALEFGPAGERVLGDEVLLRLNAVTSVMLLDVTVVRGHDHPIAALVSTNWCDLRCVTANYRTHDPTGPALLPNQRNARILQPDHLVSESIQPDELRFSHTGSIGRSRRDLQSESGSTEPVGGLRINLAPLARRVTAWFMASPPIATTPLTQRTASVGRSPQC